MPIVPPRSLPRFPANLPLKWVLIIPWLLPVLAAMVVVGYLSYQDGAAHTQADDWLYLLTLGTAISLNWIAANQITARLAQLNRVSQQLTNGNLNQRLPTHSLIYEFNGLAQSFNQMADQLQQSFDRIQTALEESEEKFTTVFRTSPDPMAIASFEGCLLEVNDSLLEFFGYSRSEMIGRTALELNLWSNLNQRQRYRALLQQQGRVSNLEAQLWTQSGEVKTVLISAERRRLEGQDCLIVTHRDIIELKQTEEKLRKTEQWLHHYSQLSPGNIYTLVRETDGRFWFEYMSSAVETIHEITVEETLQDASVILNSIHPDDRAGYQAAVLESTRTFKPFSHVWRIVTPTGLVKWLQGNSQPERRESGAIAWHGVVTDITDRQTAELALQRYERIVSATIDAISLVDRQYHYQIVNQTYLDWNCKTYTEIVGHSVSELMGQEVFETTIRPYLDRCFAGETVQYHEWFEFAGLGRQFVSVTYSPYVETDGTISGVVVSVRNLTPLKQSEAALRESEERFREIAQTVNQLFFVRSAQSGQFLYISPAYEKIWGRTCESLYQDPDSWLAAIHPEDRPLVLNSLQTQFQGQSAQREYRIIRPDGVIRWISAEISLTQDEAGQPVRYTGFAEDITDRKQLELSLRSQAEEERLLATITQTIRQSLNLEKILATTVLEIQQTLKADRVLICRLNADGSGQVIQEAVAPEYPITAEMCWTDEHFPEDCYEYYRQGQPRIVLDVTALDGADCLLEFMQSIGVQSKIVAPIVQTCGNAISNIWGLLIVHACSHCRQWQDSEAHFLQRICNQLAIAIDQANLYQQLQTELSERKQAEAALRDSDERFRQLAETVREGFFVYEVEADYYSYVNPSYIEIDGIKDVPLEQGMSRWIDRIHPDDREYVQTLLAQEQEGKNFDAEYRYLHPQGDIRWLRSQSFPIKDESGKTIRIVGTVEDITKRKQTEQALQEREAMLRAIGDNLPKGFIYQRIYEPGKGFYYSYVSAGVERLLGLKPEAILADPKAIRTIGFEEELAHADQVVQESLQHLTPIELQMRNRTAQGDIQWSSIRSVPRRLQDGRTVWDGVEVDITDLKRTEAALQSSEELFRSAFDYAPIGISLVSTTGQFVKANSCYCDLLGYSEAELLSLSFQDITHPDDLAIDLKGFNQMMAGKLQSFQIEKRYITKQGIIVPVLMSAALIRDAREQPLYCIGQVMDMRDRHRVERMKDEFISVVSHELRTPLTSIRGALGILGSGVFSNRPERAEHMLKIAINNSDRLVRLVDDILTLEKLELGKVQLVKEHCQVSTLMQQAIDSVQAIADQSTITLSMTPLAVTLWASPDAVIQTLTNLLSNAIKFSPAGETVWLKAERVAESDLHPSSPHVLFSIQDRGRGIPADKLESIFEQFQQVDVSDSRQKGGTGLGLAICKSIVQQHGGQIWVESSLGEGSTFYFTLPLIVQEKNDQTDLDYR
ncbi:PAS domain S-box protein [Egbenema bharatensis]|uniref:PAS domain S-box protein n=1 Tax=Egbenema bharatensis TaxID=3463334 RepID=UPI003A89D99F